MASRFFFKPFVTIPLDPVITGVIIHFIFHILCISVHTLLYFSCFSACFCATFVSTDTATSISMHVYYYYIWPTGCNFPVCVYRLIPQNCNIFLFVYCLVCVCAICLLFRCLGLCILSNASVYKSCCVLLSTHSLP